MCVYVCIYTSYKLGYLYVHSKKEHLHFPMNFAHTSNTTVPTEPCLSLEWEKDGDGLVQSPIYNEKPRVLFAAHLRNDLIISYLVTYLNDNFLEKKTQKNKSSCIYYGQRVGNCSLFSHKTRGYRDDIIKVGGGNQCRMATATTCIWTLRKEYLVLPSWELKLKTATQINQFLDYLGDFSVRVDDYVAMAMEKKKIYIYI